MVQFNKLKLTGFKSFVENTEINIEKGLTGIIGPNGCGKSNLVEALRWVMGENSPKRMRSTGMNDVIFAGTDSRPQRNTAEVKLEVDNTDRTAPAELNSEDLLEITRKIERDVGSVYKVNGKTVRMRDVQLLFADSSIGANSPALVSQGRVADMINAKPQQRRMVLEEAAGISGLHARRHEAELKLRAAEKNLTRVEDVLGTMDTQLESLKKQARQASRYRNISGHIEKADGTLLYIKWLESSTAVAEAMVSFNEAEGIVHDKTQTVTVLTTQQTESSAELPELRKEEADAAATLQRLKLAYGSLETEERQVQEERAKSEELLRQFITDVDHEKNQKAEAVETINRLNKEQTELEDSSQNQQEHEYAAKIKADEQQKAVTNLETELSELTEETASQEASKRAIDRQIDNLNNRQEQITSRKERLEDEHNSLIENTPAKAELEKISDQIINIEGEVLNATEAFETADQTHIDAETVQQEANEHLQNIKNNYNKLTAEASALRSVLVNKQSENFEPVLDQLTVDNGLEKALAVALGDDLQASIDGDAPIFWKELPEFYESYDLPSGIEALSNHVKAPEALKRTLSQIGLADSSYSAENAMEDLKPGQCLVTADGGAWRWDGLVITPNADNAAAIRLEQKNRLVEVDAEIENLEEELSTAKESFEQAQARKAVTNDNVKETRSEMKQAEEALNNLRRSHAKLSNEVSEVNSKLSSLAASTESAVNELEAIITELDEANQTLSDMADTTESREEIEEYKETLITERQTMAELQANHAGIRRESNNRNRRIENIKLELQNWENRLERIYSHVLDLEERITQAKDIIQKLDGRPDEIEREKQELMSLIKDAEDKRKEAADLLISSETQVNDIHRDLREAEGILSDAKEQRAMAQATVNTSMHTQTSVEEQINEKFNSTPEDLIEKLSIKIDKEYEIDKLQAKLDRLLRERENMGPVNLRAEVESQEINEKMTEMETERDDLTQAIDKLREGINKLNKEARERLNNAFETVNKHFQVLFTKLFNGGSAYMKLVETADPLEAGLEIFAQPPGKKLQSLSLLSGGEQALTSIALIFAMFLTNPAPICVLDEVDAPLDESNVDRYCSMLEHLARESSTRFIVITHHRMTMSRMDRLYGVTMGEHGVSQLVSVDLQQYEMELNEEEQRQAA